MKVRLSLNKRASSFFKRNDLAEYHREISLTYTIGRSCSYYSLSKVDW